MVQAEVNRETEYTLLAKREKSEQRNEIKKQQDVLKLRLMEAQLQFQINQSDIKQKEIDVITSFIRNYDKELEDLDDTSVASPQSSKRSYM